MQPRYIVEQAQAPFWHIRDRKTGRVIKSGFGSAAAAAQYAQLSERQDGRR